MTDLYGRDSRYRHTPAVTRADHTGRVLPADDTRPRPPTGGTFTHTVEGGDRLDQIGQRYYGKPHKWWAVVDANPEFASPLSLLGLDPVSGLRIGLVDPGVAPWRTLAALRAEPGVEDVSYDDTTNPPSVVVTYNRATTDADALVDAVRTLETPSDRARPIRPVDRVGKPIIVPPEPVP
jgi:hypothetical protein